MPSHFRPLGVLMQTNCPSSIETPSTVAIRDPKLLVRVGRVLQDMNAGRAVTDAEILQHAADCTRLMEAAYERFQANQNPADREEALLWMRRRDEARRSLSPAFKAAREAQIRQEIEQGVGYFSDQADRARAQTGGRG